MNANDLIIQPSTFNRRISVKRIIAAVDSAGGVSDQDFEERFETWASVDNMSTSRKVFLGFDAFENVYEIKCRYTVNRGFTVADIVDYLNGNVQMTLRVKSVQLVRQSFKVFSVLVCNEVVPNG
jgi:hypothetical protein